MWCSVRVWNFLVRSVGNENWTPLLVQQRMINSENFMNSWSVEVSMDGVLQTEGIWVENFCEVLWTTFIQIFDLICNLSFTNSPDLGGLWKLFCEKHLVFAMRLELRIYLAFSGSSHWWRHARSVFNMHAHSREWTSDFFQVDLFLDSGKVLLKSIRGNICVVVQKLRNKKKPCWGEIAQARNGVRSYAVLGLRGTGYVQLAPPAHAPAERGVPWAVSRARGRHPASPRLPAAPHWTPDGDVHETRGARGPQVPALMVWTHSFTHLLVTRVCKTTHRDRNPSVCPLWTQCVKKCCFAQIKTLVGNRIKDIHYSLYFWFSERI